MRSLCSISSPGPSCCWARKPWMQLTASAGRRVRHRRRGRLCLRGPRPQRRGRLRPGRRRQGLPHQPQPPDSSPPAPPSASTRSTSCASPDAGHQPRRATSAPTSAALPAGERRRGPPSSDYDYVVDAVDTVSRPSCHAGRSKAQEAGRPHHQLHGRRATSSIASRFPRGGHLQDQHGLPAGPRHAHGAPEKRGVKKLKVVYSDEIPTRPIEDMSISCRSHCICPPGAKHTCTERRDIPGSTAFVPSVAGLIIAGEVVKDLSRA